MAWKFISRARNQPAEKARQPGSSGSASDIQPTDTDKIADEQIFIARQPVFAGTEQVVGYFLSIPSCEIGVDSEVPFSTCNSARLIMNVLNNFGLEQAIGDKLAFIPISLGAFAANAIGILPPEKVVLEIQPSSVPESELAYVCEALAEKGYRYVLGGYSSNEQTHEAFLKASYIAFDIAQLGTEAAIRQANELRQLPVQRIAWNIQSKKEFDDCRNGPFDLFQGDMFTQAESWSMNRVDPSNLRVVQVFNLVMNQAELDAIEEVFKHDVGLCYSLLTYINSAGVGLPYKTHSIRHALMLLGYDYLARWLSLLIFAGVDTRAAQRVLLNTALIRGRLAELLGKAAFPGKESDQLFIVGMFSLLDALFGIPMEEALGKLNLSPDIVDALVHQSGRFRPYLELAISFEGKDLKGAEALCNSLGLDLSAASHAHLSAIEWARQLG